MNLLKETILDIKSSGHTTEDIVFIGSEKSGHSCTWNQFIDLADMDYDQMSGSSRVATDLIIVFSDGSKMWRGEYDGSEWWEYSSPFKKPDETKPIESLFCRGVGWESLGVIHGEED